MVKVNSLKNTLIGILCIVHPGPYVMSNCRYYIGLNIGKLGTCLLAELEV